MKYKYSFQQISLTLYQCPSFAFCSLPIPAVCSSSHNATYRYPASYSVHSCACSLPLLPIRRQQISSNPISPGERIVIWALIKSSIFLGTDEAQRSPARLLCCPAPSSNHQAGRALQPFPGWQRGLQLEGQGEKN